MLNKNDKRNILIVILVIIVIFGILIGIKSCDKNEVTPEPTPTPTPVVEKEEVEKVVEKTKKVIDKVVKTEEEKQYPKVDIDPSAYIVSLDDEFTLPSVSDEELEVTLTYMFKGFDSFEYNQVDEFSTEELGSYKINYHVVNKKGLATDKEITVLIIDNEKPTVEAIITRIDAETGDNIFVSVNDGDSINEEVNITFNDNDQILSIEYYNELEDNTIPGTNLEEEAMPTVYFVENDEILTLNEEGIYHIRVCDRSGNVTEYVVTIDKTIPEYEVSYVQDEDDNIKVTITSDEKLSAIDGWTLSEDGKSLIKVFDADIDEDITIKDLAGNEVVVELEYDILEYGIYQNDTQISSTQLNINDGDIYVDADGDSYPIEISYSLNDGDVENYNAGDLLTELGDYSFNIDYGDTTINLDFTISDMGTLD